MDEFVLPIDGVGLWLRLGLFWNERGGFQDRQSTGVRTGLIPSLWALFLLLMCFFLTTAFRKKSVICILL